MPTLKQTTHGGTVRFDARDFLAGLYPQYQSSINANPGYSNDQLLVANNFNPYRALGYAAPGFNPTDLTTVSVMTGLGRQLCLSAESSVDYAYIICNNARLNRLVISTKTFSNAGSWPHTITGVGTITGDDDISYNVDVASTSTPSVLYSYNDSGGSWNIGKFNTSAGTFDDDYFTTVPASAFVLAGNNKPHPMVIGADDVLYVGDGNKLHGLDGAQGTDGTAIDSALLLPEGYIIRSFAKTPDYLVVFAHYSPSGNSVNPNLTSSGRAIAVFWNYLDDDPTYTYPLNDPLVTAGFNYQGTIGCFTFGVKPVQEGENRFSRLKLFDGEKFKTVQQFIGNPPIHGGVDIVDTSIQWNSDALIHSWGSPLLNAPDGLNRLGTGSGSSNGYPNNTGLLRTIGGSTGFQVVCSGTTTTGGGQYLKVSTFAATSLIQTSAIAPLFPTGMIGKIKWITTTYGSTASGGREFSASMIKEDGGTIQFISAVSTVVASAISTKTDVTVTGGTLGTFRELSLNLNWATGVLDTSCPIVRTVDVEYENVNMVSN